MDIPVSQTIAAGDECNDISMIRAAGTGCAVANALEEVKEAADYVTERAVQEGKLSCIQVQDFKIEIWKQFLYHRDKWVSPQMESVIEYCIQREFGER